MINKITEIFNIISFGKPAEAAPVSLQRAVEIFDRLADMKDITFGFSDEGCYARAHIMCRRLIKMGVTPMKAWALPKRGGTLVVNYPERGIGWRFHTAPAIAVTMPNGIVQTMVMDPGLFDGPASLALWGKVMRAPAGDVQVVPFGAAPRGGHGDTYVPGRKITFFPGLRARALMLWYQIGRASCRERV